MRYCICLLALASMGVSSAETYRVTVTRKGANLYKIDGTRSLIQTKYCYEYVYSEDAVLRFTRGAADNKLIFDTRSPVTSCDVDALLTEQR